MGKKGKKKDGSQAQRPQPLQESQPTTSQSVPQAVQSQQEEQPKQQQSGQRQQKQRSKQQQSQAQQPPYQPDSSQTQLTHQQLMQPQLLPPQQPQRPPPQQPQRPPPQQPQHPPPQQPQRPPPQQPQHPPPQQLQRPPPPQQPQRPPQQPQRPPQQQWQPRHPPPKQQQQSQQKFSSQQIRPHQPEQHVQPQQQYQQAPQQYFQPIIHSSQPKQYIQPQPKYPPQPEQYTRPQHSHYQIPPSQQEQAQQPQKQIKQWPDQSTPDAPKESVERLPAAPIESSKHKRKQKTTKKAQEAQSPIESSLPQISQQPQSQPQPQKQVGPSHVSTPVKSPPTTPISHDQPATAISAPQPQKYQQPQPQGRGRGKGRGEFPKRGKEFVGPGPGPGKLQPPTSATPGDQLTKAQEVPRSKPSTSTDKPVEGVAKELQQLSFVQRKQAGTLGRRIQVETNHFPLIIKNMVDEAIHYDVTITPDKPKRLMRPVWEAYRKKYIPKMFPAFDEVKNIYSVKEIPENKLVGEVSIEEDAYSKPKEYKVVIKFAARVNLTALVNYMKQSRVRVNLPQDALQCIDIVLRNAPAMRFVRVGRSYFSQPRDQIIQLGDGLEMWNGFYQSAILGWKPLLNVDVAHKGFPTEMNVIDLICEITRSQDARDLIDKKLYDREIDCIVRHLKGLKIKYEIPGQPTSKRAVRVNGLAQSANQACFVSEDGKEQTVYNYYQKNKNYKIQFPNIPCLWVGSKDKRIYYPAELCTIMKGQVTNKKMNDVQTRNMVRNAATNSTIRKQKIINSVSQARYNEDPCSKEFGISVGNSFENIPARVLTPPTLLYHNNVNVKPDKGVWRSGEFIYGMVLRSWTVLNLSRSRPDNIIKFADMISKLATQLGMQISPATKPFDQLYLARDVRPLTEYFKKKKNMELIFVVVPEGDIYSKVKREAELNVGCLTQCVKEKTLFKSLNHSTINNILLKVNSKLNGVNHKFAEISKPNCLKRPCMIMGADVTHPSPEQRDRPSVAAVAASHDPSAFKYNFCWRLQPARQEIILDLENIVKEQLLFFFQQTNFKPESIIFFRDGVSEGQFQQVLNAEVLAIRRACTSFSPDYKPAITFLVVQKRHHTRFFPTNPRDSEDRNFNVPAGTCVDTDIIHPTDLEYYLVSHASIQGVARPTKYRMLWDDQNMNEDEIQTLTYYLCHMFSRCTRSVSYPAPTYYAHLAAFRASIYFEGKNINMDDLNREQIRHTIRQEIKERPMFFV